MERRLVAAFISFGLYQCTVGIKVVECEKNALPKATSGLYLNYFEFRSTETFSACFRLQFSKLQKTNIGFSSMELNSRPSLQTEIDVNKLRLVISQEYHYVHLEHNLRPNAWYHVCLLHMMKSRTLQTYFNGKLIDTYNRTMNEPVLADELTVCYIDPSFYHGLTFIGKITQLNIWSSILPNEEIQQISDCVRDTEGDILAWSKAEWQLVNSSWSDVELSRLCSPGEITEMQVYSHMSFYESQYICNALGGYVPTPKTMDEVNQFIKIAEEKMPTCKVFWLGIWDTQVEGKWTYYHNGESAVGLPWTADEPNGIYYENCGGLDVQGIIDDSCAGNRCPYCMVPTNKIWTLLGSCEQNTHNMNFMMEGEGKNRMFRGYGDYIIIQNEGQWSWVNTTLNTTVALLQKTEYNYPVGRNEWLLSVPKCKTRTDKIILVFSTCSSYEFACDDATCIPLDERCDLKYDCRDQSDEMNCQLIQFSSDYKVSVIPRAAEDGAKSPSALQITSIINIEKIQVDTAIMILDASFNLTLMWNESRAIYYNLKVDQSLNLVDQNQTLWTPSISFANSLENVATTVDDKTKTFVRRLKKSIRTNLGYPETIELFSGSENPLISYRKYKTEFNCDFELSRYPFDVQTCVMILQLTSAASSYIQFDVNSSEVTYGGIVLLLEYEVGEMTFINSELQGYSVLMVSIPLTRRFGYAVINVYLPSLTMLVISYLTLFFCQEGNFEARVMTALTTLLVMATLFAQVAASLPKTSYFKMVDIWLLCCIFTTFFIIVFHMLIDYSLQDKSKLSRVEFLSSTKYPNVVLPGKMATQSTLKNFKLNKQRTKCLSFVDKLMKSPDDIEIFGRAFIALGFTIFNLVYWIIIIKYH